MSKKSKILISSALIIIALLFFQRAYKDIFKTTSKIKQIKKNKTTFQIIKATKKIHTDKITYYSYIEPLLTLKVYSKEKGYIKKIYFDIGAYVKKDHILAELEDDDINEEKSKREATLAIQKASLKQHILDLKHKNILYKRAKDAYYERVIPIQELDDAKYQYQLTRTNIELSNNKIKEAKSSLNAIILKLKQMKVKSQINGMISKRFVEEGSLVKANELLFEILKINRLKINLSIPEKDIKKVFDKNFNIKKGTQFNVFIPSLDKHIKAHFELLHPILNKESKTIDIRLFIKNKENIKPGLSANVILENKDLSKLFLPKDAIFYDEINNEHYIQIVKNNKVYKRIVEIEQKDTIETNLIIKAGLKISDKVLYPFTSSFEDGKILENNNMKNTKKIK